jgi:predicted metal-dependent hydrolase
MELHSSEILALPGGPARIEWRRSARARRVSLRIDPRGGAVVVTLPHRTARQAGMALLIDNADWVAQRLAALPGPISFADGIEIPLHGRLHRIRHLPLARGGVWVEAGEIMVTGEATFLARRVMDFLRAEARRSIGLLVARKAALAGVKPARITLKDTSSRWGSCAANRNLAFSWRLVMAPVFVQDYVTAHEVAHLRHMNHGPQFWKLVDEITPHTEQAVAWLRLHGMKLLRVG